MPEVVTRSFPQIVADQAAVAQARAPSRALDFSVGSVLRAIAEATASVAMWLQALILAVLTMTRASTSTGENLDSWMADYDLPRVGAMRARGSVTFSRFTAVQPALIAGGAEESNTGAVVRTSEGAWGYRVLRDPAHASWNETLGGYVIAAADTQVTVPVIAVEAGAGGNAAAGTVTLLTGSIPAIDLVTNAAGFTGGTEPELDDAYRVRFRAYLASLSRATLPAVDFAISGVQAGISWQVLEWQDAAGEEKVAHFTVVVDDGSGNPPNALVSRVQLAVEAVRPLGISFSVVKPTIRWAAVSMALATVPGVDRPAVVAAVAAAVRAFINGLAVGQPLPYTRLAQVAYAASPHVTNVTSVLLENGTADIPGAPRQAIRPAVVAVS
jgi:phage-related baseplate assembly protein